MNPPRISGDVELAYCGDFSKTKDFSQKKVRLFISSTFTDTKLERNYLMKGIYPELRNHYRAMGIDFEVVDLRWGIRDEATDDHMTVPICISEIERCIKGSIGPFFVFLSGQKYGWTPLPPQIEAKEFELILLNITSPEDKEFVKYWYSLDLNLAKPSYVLHKISSKIPGYGGKNEQAREEWNRSSAKLQSILDSAVQACGEQLTPLQLVKWTTSVTAQEVAKGGLDHPTRSICFMRNIVDLLQQPSSTPKLADYVNFARGEIDKKCYEYLEDLRNKVRTTFGKENVREYDLHWSSEGISDCSTEHMEYVKQFGEDFKRAIIEKVKAALESEPLPHPHTLEVFSHGNMCFGRNKIFRGRETIMSLFKQYFQGAYDTPAVPQPVMSTLRKSFSSTDLTNDSDNEHQETDNDSDFEGFSADELDSVTPRRPQLGARGSAKPVEPPRPLPLTEKAHHSRKASHCLLVVHGASGAGKTSIMAKAAHIAREVLPKAIIIARFCGITPNSSSTFRLVESICIQLHAIFPNVNLEIPHEYRQIIKVFPNWLKLATADRPIVLFADSLDQLNDEFAAELRWIPYDLPDNVFIIVSTIGSNCAAFKELESRRTSIIPSTFIEVGELTSNELAPIIDSWLEHDGKKLQLHQRQMLDAGAIMSLNPLFLRLLYDRASKWRSFSKEEPLENSVPDLINFFLKRLETYHGLSFVTHVFGLLAASKYGLAVDEISDMLSSLDTLLGTIFQYHEAPQKRVPRLLLARLKMDCGEYMAEKSAHGTTVLGWYHIQFWKITRQRYFTKQYQEEYFSKIIANYFTGELAKIPDRGISPQPLWFESENSRTLNRRKLTELPYALIKGKMGAEAVEILTDLHWIEAICNAGLIRELINDYYQAIDSFAVQYDKQHRLRKFLQFVKCDGDVLGHYPYLTLQQAHNKPDTYLVSQSAKEILQTSPRAYAQWVDKLSFLGVSELTLKGHQQAVIFCCFSGKSSVLTCSEDKTIRIWSISTGKQVMSYKGHKEIPTCCDVYENKVASADKYRLHIWNLETGATIAKRHLLAGRFNGTTRVCKYASDGQRLVTAGTTTFWPGNPPGAVIVWNTANWKRLGISLAYSLDRSVFAVSADCKWALVRHTGNNLDMFPRLGGDKIELWDISIHPDEEDDDTAVPSYEVRDGQVVKIVWDKVINVQYYEHKGAYFIPFKYLRKGDERCKQTWPITETVSFNGNEVHVHSSKGNPPFGIANATFSPSREKQLGWYKNLAYVWHSTTKSSPNMYYRRLTGHSAAINHAVFSPDEGFIATASNDCTSRIWQVYHDQTTAIKVQIGTFDGKIRTRGKFINDNVMLVIQEDILETHAWLGDMKKFQNTHILYIKTYAVTPDGAFAVSVGGVDDTISLWDIRKGVELHVVIPQYKVTCIAFFGKHVIAGTYTKKLLVWEVSDTHQMRQLPAIEIPKEDTTTEMSFSADGQYLAIATLAGAIYLVENVISNQPVFTKISEGHNITITCMQFSPNASILGYGHACGKVWLYDINARKGDFSKQCFSNSVDGILFSEDSTLAIVSSCDEKRVRVIKVATMQEMVDYIFTMPYDVTTIAVNSKGDSIAFDSNGKKYHSKLHEMNRFTKQSILPLDPNIKPKWLPALARGWWLQLNRDHKATEDAGATFWVSSADKSVRTERNVWCQGSVLSLSAHLPANEYEVMLNIRCPHHALVPVCFAIEGNFVHSDLFVWDLAQQTTENRDTELHIGRFTVVQPCLVTFKMQSPPSVTNERSGDYRVNSLKIKVVWDTLKLSEEIECEHPVASPEDHVTFTYQGKQHEGTLVRSHGDKLLITLTDTNHQRVVASRKSILKIVPKIREDVRVTADGIPVLTSHGKAWLEGRVYQKTEDGFFFVMSIEGKPPAKYSIHTTEVMEDITPHPSDIKIHDVVLCKVDEQWLEAVVVEMYEGDTINLMDNLYRLHVQNGAEIVHEIRGLRVVTNNKATILASLDTHFLMRERITELLNAAGEPGSTHEDKSSKTPSSPTSNVSKEQLEHTIEQLFHHADVDNSGELSYEEVQTLSNSMGLFLNKSAWQSIFKSMDTDGNGSISKEELVNFWQKWYIEKGPGEKLKKKKTLRSSNKY